MAIRRGPGINPDGSYEPWKAAQTVATLKGYLLPPYRFVAFILEDDIPDLPKHKLLGSLIPFSPELQWKDLQDMEELLETFRQYKPTGDYLIAIKGKSNVRGINNPLGFVDTPILEKAIKFHKEQGHVGRL